MVVLCGARLRANTSEVTGLGVHAEISCREGKRAPQLLVLVPGEEKRRSMKAATIEVSAAFQHDSQSFGVFKKNESMGAGGTMRFLDKHLSQQQMVKALSFPSAVKILCAQDETAVAAVSPQAREERVPSPEPCPAFSPGALPPGFVPVSGRVSVYSTSAGTWCVASIVGVA